jgi:YHS domain-containing protein
VTVNAMNSNGWREYRGRIYYFCSVEHRDMFDKDPEKYAARQEAEGKVPKGMGAEY